MMYRTMSGLNSLESIRSSMEQSAAATTTAPGGGEFNRLLATSMWDQPDMVLQTKGRPVGSGKLLQQFLVKLQTIEERYAKELYGLAANWPVSRFDEGPSLVSAFVNYVSITRQRAEMHGKHADLLKKLHETKALEVSDSVLEKPCKEMMVQIKDSAKRVKKAQEQVHAAAKAKGKLQEAVVKTLGAHEAADWENRVPAKKKEKYAQVQKALHESEVAFAMVNELNNETVGRTLDAVQGLENRRVATLLHAIFSSVDHMGKLTGALWKNASQSMRLLKHVNCDTDLVKWVDKVRTGKQCPFITAAGASNIDTSVGASRTSIVSSTTPPTTVTNPFSRRSQLKIIQRFTEQRVRTESRIQAQAQKDAAKFIKLLKQKQKKQEQLKLRAQRSENEALREEQKLHAAVHEKLERRIRELTEEKSKEIQGKEVLLQQLMIEKESSDRERRELRELVQRREEELKTRGATTAAATDASTGVVDDDGDMKRPIIIDNGSAYMKVGFSGHRSPTFVIPNVAAYLPHPLGGQSEGCLSVYGAEAQHLGSVIDQEHLRVNSCVFTDQPPNWEDLEQLYQYVFDRLGVDPREHPVLVTQPSMAPLSLKKKLSRLFYETFQVPALYVGTAPVLSAYAYGSSSGLVVDVGHSSCQIVPIIDGYLLAPHVQRAHHLGGAKDTRRIADFLQRQASQRTQATSGGQGMEASVKSLVTATNIKDRLALTTKSPENYENVMDILHTVRGFTGHPDADPDDEVNVVAEYQDDTEEALPLELQEEMLRCGEVMFRPQQLLGDMDESIVSIPQMIHAVVKRCDVDTRRTLLSNVFLSGGVPTMPGFRSRLDAELRYLIPHCSEYLRIQDSESQYASWIGASVLSGLVEFQEQWVFLEEWEEAQDEALANQEPCFTLEDMRNEHLLATAAADDDDDNRQ